MYDYEYTDKIIAYIESRLVEEFAAVKSLTSFDELNVMQSVRTLYDRIDRLIRQAFLLLAQHTYKEVLTGSEHTRQLDRVWLDEMLDEYDPVTKYVWSNEIDRKRGRLAEALIASQTKVQEADAALKALSLMVRAYAVKITDEAALQAYMDEGADRVQWLSEHDSRVCRICLSRDKVIYEIEDLPPKPHYNCRCIFRRVTDAGK